jgi:hypothetical protein
MINDLLAKTVSVESALLSDLPKKDRLIQASQRLSGLELNKLDTGTRKKLDRNLIDGNRVLSQYKIETYDDYAKISDPHLDELINMMKRICSDPHKFILAR